MERRDLERNHDETGVRTTPGIDRRVNIFTLNTPNTHLGLNFESRIVTVSFDGKFTAHWQVDIHSVLISTSLHRYM